MLAAVAAATGLSTQDQAGAQALGTGPATDFRFDWAFAVAAGGPILAQDDGGSAIDELLEILGEDDSIRTLKVIELPPEMQGALVAVAAFDEASQSWQPMDGPQDFGTATSNRISVLGYEVGQEGFVEARYVEITDRPVRSFTGVTGDRRLSISLYDDPSDTHLVLQIRIGPRQLRYRLLRPETDENG